MTVSWSRLFINVSTEYIFGLWRDPVSGGMEMRFLNDEKMQLRVVFMIQ
jgi:hypothetical protein